MLCYIFLKFIFSKDLEVLKFSFSILMGGMPSPLLLISVNRLIHGPFVTEQYIYVYIYIGDIVSFFYDVTRLGRIDIVEFLFYIYIEWDITYY